MVINRGASAYALAAAFWCGSGSAAAATIFVAAGGNLQQALNAAQPGDTILLEENAEFVGNFVLPVKTGEAWITLRTAAPDALLPPAGVRIRPSHAPLLARLRSPNGSAALRTAAGAHHWAIRYLDFPANKLGGGDIIKLGDGSSAQSSLAQVPHHIVVDHAYVHGDPLHGQKRGIALNAAHTTITDSHIAECKGVGQDTQAIGGWNGPGPYLIENNYLEAAGENVLFGGSDPAIPNLVADGITFRRNYVSRPMAWRGPIIPTPLGVAASAVEGGGSLPAGVYGYRVVARRPIGSATGRSTASAEVVASTALTGAVRVRWNAVPGASEYRVYGRTAGAEAMYWRVTTTEFIDTGAAGASEAVPTSAGTVWSVKNTFELKNARNVVIENNIFENHWKESQPGSAIVLTPRNSNGGCTWCVVENVRFANNLVRNVAAGINLLGYDVASRPTRQSANIAIERNLFTGLSTTLGGNGWFLQIGDEPRNVTIAHNTVDSNGNAVVYTYGGSASDPREIHGFQMIANAARHGSYGFNGQNFAYGNAVLAGYFPDAVFASNYFAGAPASRYPFRTLVVSPFQDQFVNVAGGDYTVREASVLHGAAPDGSDVGVDFPALMAALEGVQSGLGPAAPAGDPAPTGDPTPIPPTVDFTAVCHFLTCAFADVSIAGTTPLVSLTWSFDDGAAPASSSSGSPSTHTFAAYGSYTVGLTVTDANGVSTAVSKTIAVETGGAPTAAYTASCVDLACTFTDRSTDADGTIAAWAWSVGGAAPVVSFTFAAHGTHDVSLIVADDDGVTSTVTAPVEVVGRLHAAYAGTTSKWSSASGATNYWRAEVAAAVHGLDERAIAGATVTAAWSGAVVKTVTCVTDLNGRCTFKSGTLSYRRSTVTLNVISVVARNGVYEPGVNHSEAAAGTPAFTLIRP